ncbi:AAA family ATPase [Xanthocytophaga flava]|uniref:AAA family ATPase n=1 Tax=Xanthocytophaga flava TaxID=3048013 RepID=UPI0028D1634B|nr:AAA family ATPase [Xanthocytophaga flavus]MDJ1472628.1 AAA family ATPase [Xanthocytophaga flavus]
MNVLQKELAEFAIVRKYQSRFDWMKNTPQDSVHHQEGNVYIHTEMVLNALLSLPEFQELSEYEQRILTYTAVFHDICKPDTMQTWPGEAGRISHPRHALRGATLTRQILDKENESLDFISKVYSLVRFHGYPFWVLNRENPLKDAIRLSLLTNTKWLYIFAKADLLGRICNTHNEMLYNLELFREFCIEHNIYGETKQFASEYDRFHYFNVDSAYPDTQLYPDYALNIYLMCGLPAAGKDSYLRKHLTDLPQVHLDGIREEFDIDPTDNQGQVIQISRERSKEFCRKRQSFVWNATNINVQIRSTLIGMWLPYKPKIHIIHLHKNIGQILSDNAKREDEARVPDSKILNMFERFEFPDITECHELKVISC